MTGEGRAMDCELRQADERARELAQRCFDKPLVLEAGAGTGKTAALVARVLAWSLGPGWVRAELAETAISNRGREDRIAARVLRGVAAITFTEKAAAEMSDRVAVALLGLQGGEIPVWLLADALPADLCEVRRRAGALRGALDHLTVQTIHAFCRRLLGEHALDAGLHPHLEVDADGRAQADAVRSVIEDWLRTAYVDPQDPGLLRLGEKGMGPPELEAALLALLDSGLPASALEEDVASPARIAALVVRLRKQLTALAEAAGAGLPQRRDLAGATAVRLGEILAFLTERPPTDRAGLVDWIGWLDGCFEANERNRLADWGRGRFLKGERDALGDRSSRLAPRARELSRLLEHVLSIDLQLLDAARRVLRPMLTAVEAQLRCAGVATFPALLGHVRRLLVDRPDVACRVRAGIDQLLVDEFQDTDRTQCDIIRELALRGPKQVRPSLFVVGDPKQSIYGWRNADLAAYADFVAEVLAADGRQERLSVNYRSVPRVLDAVEHIIAPVMQEEPGLQPRFQPLIASPENARAAGFACGGRACVEHWVPAALEFESRRPRPTKAAEASRIEANALATDLRDLHDSHGVAWPSMGVLFRSRGDWEVYLSALRASGVPHAVEGDRNYYRRREIIEAASLLRCVIDPNDPIALLSYLRSAAVGVPDAALIPLWLRQLPERLQELWEPSPAALGALEELIRAAARAVPADTPGLARVCGWEENLLGAVVEIGRLRASFALDPADVFVEKLRTGSWLEVTEASRHSGAWRCANLERFFRDIGAWLSEARDVHELLRRLRRAVAGEEPRDEGRPAEGAGDAVQVMTIHGAKGLDFDHVYLMQLHKGNGGYRGAGVGAEETRDGFEYQLMGAPSLGWDCVTQQSARVAEAERARLLYVAMTRARQRLVLSGLSPEYQIRSSAGRAIELVRPVIGSNRELAEFPSSALGESAFDASGARWFWPALAPATERRSMPTKEGVPSARKLAAASKCLTELRHGASERMQRPFAATASGQAHTEAAQYEGTQRDQNRRSPTRQAARSIGTAIHRCLEGFDFAAEPAAEFQRQRAALARAVELVVAPGEQGGSLELAEQLLDRIAQGRLFARLRILANHIVARELPVLLPPLAEEDPIAYWTGTIDLLYRDPSCHEFVVVDYKTDLLSDSADLQTRADRYARQGALYQRAIREALDLPYTPRFELWFLDADRIVEPGCPPIGKISPAAANHL